MSSTAKSIEEPSREPAPARVAVWDLPVRLFHWGLAGLIALSWWTAETQQLEVHLYSGYAILSLIIFRVLWGIFGSSTARFAGFLRHPREILAYVRDPATWRALGHNPLGALSVLAMLVVLKLQVATGLLNADDDGLIEGPLSLSVSERTVDFAHVAHEFLWNLLLALIAIHVVAVLYHQLIARKNVIGPMITGKTVAVAGALPMRPGRWWVAALCLLAGIAITRGLIALGG